MAISTTIYKGIEPMRCPICGAPPRITGNPYTTWRIECCGYEAHSVLSAHDCVRNWNKIVNGRNELMKGGIKREMGLLNNYMVNDAIKTATVYAELDGLMARRCAPEIKKVHFNKPVTCVIWTDGTKTLVRAQDGETYDPEKGMALAIAKKFLGNKGNYYNVFDKYLSELEKVDCKECPGTDHGRKTECTWNQDIPCPTKKDVEKSRKKE